MTASSIGCCKRILGFLTVNDVVVVAYSRSREEAGRCRRCGRNEVGVVVKLLVIDTVVNLNNIDDDDDDDDIDDDDDDGNGET